MSIVELESGQVASNRPPRHSLARLEALWGLFFISPWIIGFTLLTLIPMIATFVFTFTNINLIQDEPIRFVGLENYANLVDDPRTWDALLVTFKFAAIALPVGLLLPFALALLLNSKSLRGSRYFQALFFMPFVIPFVAAIFAWQGMLNPEAGWINGALERIRGQRTGLAERPELDLSVAHHDRAVGHRQRDHHQRRGPPERPDRAVRRIAR